MKGLNSKSYLTRSMLNKIFKKKLTNSELENLIWNGTIIKRFSYYQPSEKLLRKMDLIKSKIEISDNSFAFLAKRPKFVLREIKELFGVNQDEAVIISKKYFIKKYNYWYKNDILIDLLNDGVQEIEI